METKFNFKSQPCTSCEQSERLLALGLKKETADFYTPIKLNPDKGSLPCLPDFWTSDEPFIKKIREASIPAWSLHRLIEMMPKRIVFGRETFERTLKPTSISYSPLNWPKEFARCCSTNENYFDCVIDCIAKLINEGYFNKEYLEE